MTKTEQISKAFALSLHRAHLVELVCEGLTNQQISERTGMAVGTVKKYLTEILADTGCKNRSQLILKVAEAGVGFPRRE